MKRGIAANTMQLARDLTLRRGTKLVVRNANLSVGPGVTVLVGPNGAGKTSLLECIAGLLKPTSGSAPAATPVGHGTPGLVPQDPVLPGRFRVGEALQYSTWLRGGDWGSAKESVELALQQVNLADRVNTRIARLSGG